ncbi:MAG: hypothetical protein Kilf2KO_26400 [Rhodospirillales bacterium]
MRCVMQTPDPVLLSFAQAVLRDAGIEAHVFDVNIAITEGSVGIFPRRLCVVESLERPARLALEDAGLSADLTPE